MPTDTDTRKNILNGIIYKMAKYTKLISNSVHQCDENPIYLCFPKENLLCAWNIFLLKINFIIIIKEGTGFNIELEQNLLNFFTS